MNYSHLEQFFGMDNIKDKEQYIIKGVLNSFKKKG